MGRIPEDDKIDVKSQNLIVRIHSSFKARAIQLRVAFLIVQEFMVWFSKQDTYQLRDSLTAKMIRGAREHGPVNRKQAQKELEEEYLDLFGWTLKRDL